MQPTALKDRLPDNINGEIDTVTTVFQPAVPRCAKKIAAELQKWLAVRQSGVNAPVLR